MPDSIIVYLNKSVRTELADYVDMKVGAAVKNALGDTTKIDVLTNDYIAVRLSGASVLEMKLLPKNGNEIIICMVRTYYGPAAESVISFYSADWCPLENSLMPPAEELGLMVKPGGMTEKEFGEIKNMMEPKMIEFRLSAEDTSLAMNYSIPEVSEEDKVLIRKILVQKKLNWNGTRYK